MLPARLDSISESHLKALVTNGIQESRSLEFKAKLVWGTESERKEFLADVSALANGGGGDLILGVKENSGAASAVVGLNSFDPDNDTLKMESMIRDGIKPRIIGVRIQPVPLCDGRRVVVVRVPNSLNRPHMVVFKNSSRFYSRNSAGKYQLDVDELRSAFLASESIVQRVRQFRLERIDAILQGNAPERLSGKNYVCMHLIPLSAFDPSFYFDLAAVREGRVALPPIAHSGWNPGVNFDGLLFYTTTGTGQTSSYVQLFRNGVIEAVDSQTLTPLKRDQQESDKYIPSIAYEKRIIDAVDDYIGFYKKYEMPTPLLVGLSILNVKGFRMRAGDFYDVGSPIDRDHLILPDRLAESLDLDAAELLRPSFDQIWNACGYDRSLNYNEKGSWNPDR